MPFCNWWNKAEQVDALFSSPGFNCPQYRHYFPTLDQVLLYVLDLIAGIYFPQTGKHIAFVMSNSVCTGKRLDPIMLHNNFSEGVI
jgi:hypothetical protein